MKDKSIEELLELALKHYDRWECIESEMYQKEILRRFKELEAKQCKCNAANSPEIPDSSQISDLILRDIVDDLTNRRGLKNEWFSIDDKIKLQILDNWKQIILNNLQFTNRK